MMQMREKIDLDYGYSAPFVTCRYEIVSLCGYEAWSQSQCQDYLRWEWKHKIDLKTRSKFQAQYRKKLEDQYYRNPIIKQETFYFDQYKKFLHDQLNFVDAVCRAKKENDVKKQRRQQLIREKQRIQQEWAEKHHAQYMRKCGKIKQNKQKQQAHQFQEQIKTTPNKEEGQIIEEPDKSTTKKNVFNEINLNRIEQEDIQENLSKESIELIPKSNKKSQKVEDDEISVATLIEVSDYADKKRISKKTKTAKVYRCKYCNLVHHDLKRIMNHKRGCQKRKEMKVMKERNKQQKMFHERFRQKKNVQSQKEHPKIKQMREEILQLKTKIQRLQGKGILLAENELQIYCQNLATSILFSIKENIFQSVKIQLVKTLKDASSSGMDVKSLDNLIKAKLIAKFSLLSYDDILSKGAEILEESHRKLVKHNIQEGKRKRTMEDCERSRQFFEKYKQIDFYFQARIVMDLIHLPENTRKDHCLYFRKLRKLTSFETYPALPDVDSVLPWKQITPTFYIQSIAEWVQKLVSQKQFELACDIWMIASLGLNPQQLKQLYFFTSDNKPITSIKILEPINRKIVIRYVPLSLIRLIKTTKVAYPATWNRMTNAKLFYIKQIKSFYALRHLLSAKLVQILAYTHRFNIFDSKSSTQLPLYEQGKIELDKYFNLMLKLDDAQCKQTIQLSFIDKEPRQTLLNALEVTLDDNTQSFRGFQLDEFLIHLRPLLQTKNNNQFKQKLGPAAKRAFQEQIMNKEHLIANSMLFKQYNYELSEECSEHQLMGLLIKISNQMKDRYLLEQMSDYMQKTGMLLTSQNLLKAAAIVLHKKIVFWSSEQIFLYEPHKDQNEMHEEKDEQPLILAHTSQGFHAAQQQLKMSQKRERQSKIKASQLIKEASNTCELSYNPPKCYDCKTKSMVSVPDKQSLNRGILECYKCCERIEQHHYQKIELKPCQNVKIFNLSTDVVELNHSTLQQTKNKNNLKQSIETDFGQGSYTTTTRYTLDIPNLIQTYFCRFSKQISQSIRKNRRYEQYLPLQVKPSPIAGKGLFATADLAPNRIVITYVGTIASTYTATLVNDSLFTLGWITSKPPRELFVTPEFGTNAGRYMNGADKQHPPNCKAHIGIFDENEIVVYFYTIKTVKQGEELLFNYGSLYDFNVNSSHSSKNVIQEEDQIFESD